MYVANYISKLKKEKVGSYIREVSQKNYYLIDIFYLFIFKIVTK